MHNQLLLPVLTDILSEIIFPPNTAKAVQRAWPNVPPNVTPTGSCVYNRLLSLIIHACCISEYKHKIVGDWQNAWEVQNNIVDHINFIHAVNCPIT